MYSLNVLDLKKAFTELGDLEFQSLTEDKNKCLELLATLKWHEGYICRKCGHHNYCNGSAPFSRRCTRCKYQESAIANTPFHGCRMPLTSAFKMVGQICCRPEISTYELSRENNIRQMTCWKLKNKLLNYGPSISSGINSHLTVPDNISV